MRHITIQSNDFLPDGEEVQLVSTTLADGEPEVPVAFLVVKMGETVHDGNAKNCRAISCINNGGPYKLMVPQTWAVYKKPHHNCRLQKTDIFNTKVGGWYMLPFKLGRMDKNHAYRWVSVHGEHLIPGNRYFKLPTATRVVHVVGATNYPKATRMHTGMQLFEDEFIGTEKLILGAIGQPLPAHWPLHRV